MLLLGIAVEDRVFSWGLTAGVIALLLVFSTAHGGWWRAAASPVTPSQAYEANVTPTRGVSNPFAAASEYVPAPTTKMVPAIAHSFDAIAPSDAEPLARHSEGDTIAEVDYGARAQQQNRGVEHGARTH
jgi:hypothetical protein